MSTDFPNQLEPIIEPVNHILLWMPNWIGDVVFSLPTVQAIRKRFPKARITGVVRPPSHEFLSRHPAFDSVIGFPRQGESGFFSQIRFAFGLRKYKFDLAVVFPNSTRSAMLTSMAGSVQRVGYDTEGRSWLLTHSVPVTLDSRKVHGADYYAGVAQPLGIEPVERTFPSLITRKEQKNLGDRLKEMGLGGASCILAVHPGASKPEKRWHEERFGILCQKLIKEKNARILLLGSDKERGLLEKVAGFCPKTHVFPMVDLNLIEVLALLSNCRLLIANDSGLMNLAAMGGIPVVGIFGPGHPSTTDPMIRPEKKELVTLEFSCSPCRHRFFRDCEPSPHQKPFCLEDISVTQVADAVDRLLARTN